MKSCMFSLQPMIRWKMEIIEIGVIAQYGALVRST